MGYERIIENELESSWDDEDDEYEHIEKFSNIYKYKEA